MTTQYTVKEVKEDLKIKAAEIKQLKSTRKSVPNGYVPGLSYKQYDYRHLHIAYCLFRGRTIEQIEKPREGNEHNKYAVERYLKMIIATPRIEKEVGNAEAVCDCA